MDIDAILRRPPELEKPPIRRMPDLHRSGGSCHCLCHTDEARRLMAVGLALLGGFAYLLGVLVGSKNLRR